MRSVTVNKTKLLEIVKANKDKHVAEYKEAVEDYFNACKKIAKSNLDKVMNGTLETISTCRNLPSAPKTYEDEYNRAIRMLELSVDTEIDLESDVFNQLVLDEWNWKNNFTMMASTYKSF